MQSHLAENQHDLSIEVEEGHGLHSVLRFRSRYNDGRRIAASSGAPEIHAVLASRQWTPDNIGQLAIEAINTQLNVYNITQMSQATPSGPPSISEEICTKLLSLTAENPEDDVLAAMRLAGSPDNVDTVWKWEKMPYPIVRFAIAQKSPAPVSENTDQAPSNSDDNGDLDNWVLANEKWLRNNYPVIDDWKRGLVNLTNHAQYVFPGSIVTSTSRIINRTRVSGFNFLDNKRAPQIQIQPSVTAFERKLEELTNGQLRGLSWNNVFIAGGMVLGTLLSVDGPTLPAATSADQWKGSDIDFYIYGLNPLEANEKVRHLFDIFKKNLPQDAPTLVVRNSKTISFLSYYPLRRFQIVLKKVTNPKEVLMNFDLDICAVGYDGNEVWMLPRATRALETGYNVFTMDMVQGHYLGDRRASQEQRVFKYANKGYGIRILPSYLEALPLTVLISKQHRGRKWFERIYRSYMSWSNNGRDLRPTYCEVRHAGLPPPIPLKERRPDIQLPIFSHALMDTKAQISSQPGSRSCLTGLELFYRHIALWEAEAAERIVIQDDVWASTTYGATATGYDDLPQYRWDESFVIDDFTDAIDSFNREEASNLKYNMEFTLDPNKSYLRPPKEKMLPYRTVQRMVYGDTIDDVFSEAAEIAIPLLLPDEVIEFANNMITKALSDAGLDWATPFRAVTQEEVLSGRPGSGTFVLWNISTVLMWQQIDRRIDEVHEILWSFHRANDRMQVPPEARFLEFQSQLSRRAIYQSPQQEMDEFRRWALRGPGPISGLNYGSIGQGFWDQANSDEEEEEEEESDRPDSEASRSYDADTENIGLEKLCEINIGDDNGQEAVRDQRYSNEGDQREDEE